MIEIPHGVQVFVLLGIALVQPAAAQKKAPEAAQAEISGGVVKLGVLTDETGVLSTPSGEGSIEATRMAVEDFGGKAAGKPIEIIHADHQNKTDIDTRRTRFFSLAISCTASAIAELGTSTMASTPSTSIQRRAIAAPRQRAPRHGRR